MQHFLKETYYRALLQTPLSLDSCALGCSHHYQVPAYDYMYEMCVLPSCEGTIILSYHHHVFVCAKPQLGVMSLSPQVPWERHTEVQFPLQIFLCPSCLSSLVHNE